MSSEAPTRKPIDLLGNQRWLPKRIHALDSIAFNNHWKTNHYIDDRRGLHSVFTYDKWRIEVQWSFKGDIRNAHITSGPGTRQKMPKEFRDQAAFTWVADLLYDIGQPQEQP